ncbi:NAD-dependent epimerase/dehydratase family protein [Streptomyces sp. NPDC048664]|uniref:NAD-dependent epimerase/dehydratase family protein n=1 Tax=Streptomyces sp. NPDC048664 TaxID=3154505 RepID=UPI003443F431
MEIIGSGFLAGALAPLAASHPHAVAAAFGVSYASGVPEAEFTREAVRLYELLRDCERRRRTLVFFSTASPAMYALPGQAGREDGPVFPSTAYGRHNLALEAVLAASGVDHLVLRLAHVVGPGQPGHLLVPAMVRQVRSGRVRLHRGARRDLIDVADVVTVLDRLLETGVNRTVVNVASGRAVPIESLVDHIEARLGTRAARTYVDGEVSGAVSTARLHRLVPEIARTGEEDYHRRVLDTYLGAYAADGAVADPRPDPVRHPT